MEKSYIERQHLMETLLAHHPDFIDGLTLGEANALRAYYGLDDESIEDLREHGRRFETEHGPEVALAVLAFDKILKAAGLDANWEVSG